MKICLINNLYKPFSRGGAERIVDICAQGFRDAGNEIFVITTKPIFKKIDRQGSKTNIYYINSVYYDLNKLPKIVRLFWHFIDIVDIGSYIRIKAILKKEKPHVVITHNLKGLGGLAPRAIKSLNIKHIHTLHDIQLLHPSGLVVFGKEKKLNTVWSKIYKKINICLFKKTDIIISPSKWLLDKHLRNNFFAGSKQFVLPNPATEFKAKSSKDIINSLDVIKLLYIGHINEAKGIMFLVQVFKKLNLKCELYLAGNSYDQYFKKKISQYKNIHLLGYINREKVEELMRSSDLLVVPSLCYENSPTVIYEAADLGLPVLASRIGGIEELVHFLGGILFKPGSEEELLEKINWAIKNPHSLRRIGEQSRNKVKNYRLEKYIKKVISIINNN